MHCLKDIVRKIHQTRWTIGFIEGNVECVLSGRPYEIKWIKHNYHDRWFADPFILDVDDNNIIILVEEYYYPIHRGRISKMVLDRKTYEVVSLETIIEEPTHLSFPAIFRKEGKIFIYPESGASKKLILYEYDKTTNKCENVEVLCMGELADAILTDITGEPLLFATEKPEHNGSNLFIYKKDGDLFSKMGTISFYRNVARNAGDWFLSNGEIFRPAQDCSETYGGAVILQHITNDNGKLLFDDVRRIESTNPNYPDGCHTFNFYKDLIVVDGKGYRYQALVKIWSAISRIRKYITQ